MLPQVSFMIGPKISGKATLAKELASRTNARQINFNNFCRDHDLVGKDDDTIVLALI